MFIYAGLNLYEHQEILQGAILILKISFVLLLGVSIFYIILSTVLFVGIYKVLSNYVHNVCNKTTFLVRKNWLYNLKSKYIRFTEKLCLLPHLECLFVHDNHHLLYPCHRHRIFQFFQAEPPALGNGLQLWILSVLYNLCRV